MDFIYLAEDLGLGIMPWPPLKGGILSGERKTIKLSAVLFSILLLLAACHDTGKKKDQHADHTAKGGVVNAPVNQADVVRKLLKSKQIYPVYLMATDDSNKEFICLYASAKEDKAPDNLYLYGDASVHIYVEKFQLTGPQEIKTMNKQLIIQEEWTYCNLDSASQKVTIAGKPYLYFSYSTEYMGNAVLEKTIQFCLVSLNDLKSERLSYLGTPSWKCDGCLEGDIKNEKNVKMKPELLAFLNKKIAGHPGIYHSGKNDKDRYHVINYQTKWEQDNNNADNHYANGHGDIADPVKTTYYDVDLLKLQQGSDFEVAENDRYFFQSYFNGNIIGYDKEKKLYFPLMIEDCNAMCSKKISMVNEVLKISYGEGDNYEVSLNKLIFDPRTGHK